MRRVNKFTFQTLGFALIVIGIILLIAGIIGQNTPTHCPANGCPPDVLWRIYGPSIISFYLGVALVVVGVMLLFAARRMKPGMEADSVASIQSRELGSAGLTTMTGVAILEPAYSAVSTVQSSCPTKTVCSDWATGLRVSSTKTGYPPTHLL